MKTKIQIQSLPIEVLIKRTKTDEQLEHELSNLHNHREADVEAGIGAIQKENHDQISDDDLQRLLNIELNKSKKNRYRVELILAAGEERGLRLDEGDGEPTDADLRD